MNYKVKKKLTIHLVYPHKPKISNPDIIGFKLLLGLRRENYRVIPYDLYQEIPKSFKPKKNDVLLGHPRWEKNCAFNNLLKKNEWGRIIIIHPFCPTDLSRAIYKAIQYKGRRTVFNIGSGIGVSINELITIIEATTGLTASIDYKPSRTSDVKINILDCSLAKKELLWEPLVGLDEGILKIFNESKK